MANAMFSTAAGPREFGRIYPPRRDWLARQVPEAAREPELPIIDAHFHFLDLPGFHYMGADWAAEQAGCGHRIVGSVYAEAQTGYRTHGLEALRPVGEVELVERETRGRPGMAMGIVGHADLMLGAAVEQTLAGQLEAGEGRFKGIRYALALDSHPDIAVHHRPPDDWMTNARFHEGLKVLTRLGLSFDAWAFFHQQGEVAALARRHPELNMVVLHCGGLLGYGPYQGRADEVFQSWLAKMREVAACPNTSIKLGGTLGRLAAYDYLNADVPEPSTALAAAVRPYLLSLIDLFGPGRCMFESNYPVDTVVTGYGVLWNTYKHVTADFTENEKIAMYGGTARRIYRLDPAQS
jgi:predicted TIM-barrel fold metal-dependent hydrolase